MPRLIALGGLSGVGKSTIGFALRDCTPALGSALVLDNDVTRRELLARGLGETLTADCYTDEVSARVRDRMDANTREALAQGRDVIDTSGFWGRASRQQVEALAKACNAAFVGLWLDAPLQVLQARIARRLHERATLTALSASRGHASDADHGIAGKYSRHQPVGPQEPWTVIDASGEVEEILPKIMVNIR